MTKNKFKALCEEFLIPHIECKLKAEFQNLEDMLAVMSAAIGRLDAFIDEKRLEEFQVNEEDMK